MPYELRLVLALVMFLRLGVPLPQNNQVSENQTWTFLLYLAGDTSNIAPFLNRDSPLGALYRLEHALPNPQVNVVALYDGNRRGGDDSFRYIFRSDGQVTQESLGEVNTGDPQTLVDFVRWGQQSAPADHYYLVIAGHGNGLDGIAWDLTSGPAERLTNVEMRQALMEVTEDSGQPIDVLHFDGCRMGMLEYVYQIRGMASFLIATEDIGWSAFSYEKYRAAVGSQMRPQEFANIVVQQYAAVVSGYPYTIAALDMAQIDSVVRAADSMARELLEYALASEDNRARLAELREQVQKIDSNEDLILTNDDEYVDLGHWAELVTGAIDNPAIRGSAAELQVALQQFVMSERHGSGRLQDTFIGLAQAQGVAIYFPDRANARTYTDYRQGELDFLVDTLWDEFLTAVLPVLPFEPITTPPAAPIAITPVPTPGLVTPTPTQSAAPNTVQASQSVMSRFPFFGNLAEVTIEWMLSVARLLQRFDRADWIR